MRGCCTATLDSLLQVLHGDFQNFFFDNNVCNRKRSTYLKGFFKTSSKSRIIKLLVKSRSNTPFTCKPLSVQRSFLIPCSLMFLVWFIPIQGFICAACQTFVANEGKFESHTNEKSHKDNVDKFKRILVRHILMTF